MNIKEPTTLTENILFFTIETIKFLIIPKAFNFLLLCAFIIFYCNGWKITTSVWMIPLVAVLGEYFIENI